MVPFIKYSSYESLQNIFSDAVKVILSAGITNIAGYGLFGEISGPTKKLKF